MLKNKIIDFESLTEKVEQVRLEKELYKFDLIHYNTKKFPNGKETQNCFLCAQPLIFGMYSKGEIAICSECFHVYIKPENYLEHISEYKNRIQSANAYAQQLTSLLDNKKKIDVEILNDFLKGLSITDVEFYIGFPTRFGSFDHGLESGFWTIASIKIEIWFQNRVCIEVDLLN